MMLLTLYLSIMDIVTDVGKIPSVCLVPAVLKTSYFPVCPKANIWLYVSGFSLRFLWLWNLWDFLSVPSFLEEHIICYEPRAYTHMLCLQIVIFAIVSLFWFYKVLNKIQFPNQYHNQTDIPIKSHSWSVGNRASTGMFYVWSCLFLSF